MVGWHHQLNGHGFEQTLGDSWEYYSPWGHKELGQRLAAPGRWGPEGPGQAQPPPPPPGGFCCKVGAQPRASPSHPTSQVIPNILLYLHGVPCPPCAAISRGGSGSRQGSGHHDTSHDSAAVLGSGSGRGSREPRCSHAAASACAQCPPCARPSFWACHHGHSAREHNRVLTKADFHPHLLRPRGFSAAGRRCQS